ncbi:MAG: hypothetical protein KC468_31605, partial [Myxococcales bacterium]|nr:hypothetical protein [Myxococcales bacterium]
MHESPVARLLTPISIGLALGCGDAGAAASATATSDAEMTASPTTSGAASTGAATGAQATGDGSDGSGSSGSSASDGDTTAAGATSDSEPTVGGETEDPEPASRPLAVHADNPRYFDDGAGAAIVLVGVNHGWELQDDAWDVDYALDFDAFLDYLEAYQLNFIRLWRVESPKQTADDAQLATPTPYLRTGPGVANDGMPRFDLEQLDPAYFARLHERCAAAAARGIYVDIMLFERHSTFHHNGPAWPWSGHPFHASNNVNGVDADANADGQGREYFLLPEEGGDA